MALTALLADLRRLHHWRLELWHGDHGWRAESAQQAGELQAWAKSQRLPFLLERAATAPASEAAGRQWRYACLRRQAEPRGCSHVVTGHTASDRAETLLLNLARGSHRRGLASLRPVRPLTGEKDGGRTRQNPRIAAESPPSVWFGPCCSSAGTTPGGSAASWGCRSGRTAPTGRHASGATA